MKLKFLGKRKKSCNCGKGIKYENQTFFSLYSPYGTKQFQKGVTYDFSNVEEYEYWSRLTYRVSNITYYYFQKT